MKAISVKLMDLKQEGKEVPEELINEMQELEQLVYQLRIEQKGFFKSNRSETKKHHLIRSKELEKQLDNKLSDMGYSEQQNLF